MVQSHELEKVAEYIEGHESFLITSHVLPDGDSLGSSAALRGILCELGKKAEILLPDRLPDRYDFFADEYRIYAWTGLDKDFIKAFDGLFVLDCSGWSRLGNLGPVVKRNFDRVACIDHHICNEAFADVSVVDPSASATAELIYRLTKVLGHSISPDVAGALYIGIMTDTGSFSFGNTTSAVFSIVADLVDRGADPQSLYRKVFERYTLHGIEFMRRCLEQVGTEADGRLGLLPLPYELFKAYDARIDDAYQIMKYVRGLRGVRLMVAMFEDEPGRVKTSFRSHGEIDVSRLAACFGGGGHRAAAGALMECTLEEAQKRILEKALPLVVDCEERLK